MKSVAVDPDKSLFNKSFASFEREEKDSASEVQALFKFVVFVLPLALQTSPIVSLKLIAKAKAALCVL